MKRGVLRARALATLGTMLGCGTPEATSRPAVQKVEARAERAYTYEDGVKEGLGPAEGWLTDGVEYKLTRRTPLMPEVDPADPAAAIMAMQWLDAGVIFRVHAIQMKAETPWYRVVTRDWKSGWINSIALLGQNVQAVRR